MSDKPKQCGEQFQVAVGNKSQKCGYTRFWYAVYECECGTRFPQQVRHIENGKTVSCGCHKRQSLAISRRTHGLSHTPEYHIWLGMKKRCENRRCKAYRHYGGRGVVVCERWQTFENFYADMGTRPSPKHSIDRKDVNGNYEPGNCRWATDIEQARNTTLVRVVDVDGNRMCLSEACESAGLPYSCVRHRLVAGAGISEALSRPVRQQTRRPTVTFCGEDMTLSEACRRAGVLYNTAAKRLRRGETIERALRPVDR